MQTDWAKKGDSLKFNPSLTGVQNQGIGIVAGTAPFRRKMKLDPVQA